MLAISIIARATVVPPSGDETGAIDGAAINTALSSNLSATLECNSHYYTNVSLQVVGGASLLGCGNNTLITGVGTITGGIVQLSAASTDEAAGQLVGNFQITGGTATNAVRAGGSEDSGPYCNDGDNGTPSPCWPWIVRASGSSGGVTTTGDSIYTGSYFTTGTLQYAGSGNQHFASYRNSAGSTVLLSVVPQAYP